MTLWPDNSYQFETFETNSNLEKVGALYPLAADHLSLLLTIVFEVSSHCSTFFLTRRVVGLCDSSLRIMSDYDENLDENLEWPHPEKRATNGFVEHVLPSLFLTSKNELVDAVDITSREADMGPSATQLQVHVQTIIDSTDAQEILNALRELHRCASTGAYGQPVDLPS